MKIRTFRILGAVLAALLPACGGGGGHGSGGTSGGGTGNPAFPVTMTEPKGGQTFTAPATISLSAVATDPASVAKVEFVDLSSAGSGPDPNTWFGGNVVATSTQPPFQATWTDVRTGSYTLATLATDNQGVQTYSNTVTISVLGPGESPGGWVRIATLWSGSGKIWFVDARRGWVTNRGIQHTVDGGATWVVQLASPPNGGFGDIQFVDGDRGWAVASTVSGTTVLRTTDGGATWTPSPVESDPPFFGNALSFVDSKRGWIVGSGLGEKVFVTRDGGVTWTPLPTGIPGIASIDAVHFVDPLNGWVMAVVQSTQDGQAVFSTVILRSTDGGLNWTEQFPTGAGGLLAMDFVSATTGWISRAESQMAEVSGRILFTNDGGATWTEQTYPVGGTIFGLDFISPTQGWGVGGRPNTIIHTDDGGATWVTQQPTGGAFDFAILGVRFIDANVGWAIRADGILLKTTTGGKAP